VWGVALTRWHWIRYFFFRHFKFSVPFTIPQNVLVTSVFGGPFRNPCVTESVLNCGFSWR
jgi:hypothetical protein